MLCGRVAAGEFAAEGEEVSVGVREVVEGAEAGESGSCKGEGE